MSIQEKKDEIVSVLDDLPENIIDHLLELIKEEKHQNNTDESILKDMERRGIIKLPVPRKSQKTVRTPLNISGKPLSQIIIEDRTGRRICNYKPRNI